jgi:hypothetical protein
MFSTNPQRILEEIETSAKFRDDHIRMLDEIVAGYHGAAWKIGSQVNTPENYAFNWVATMGAKLAFSIPRTKVNAGNDPASIYESQGLERAANRWMRKSDYGQTLARQVVDFGFAHGVTMVSPQMRPGEHDKDAPIYWPVIDVLDIRDVVWDRLARTPDKIRFIARRVITDKEDLLKRAEDFHDEGWDKTAIETMQVDGVRRDSTLGSGPMRGEVEYWECYIPEVEVELTEDEAEDTQLAAKNGDKLYNGSIHCVAYVSSGKAGGEAGVGASIRAPRAFFGPREGPFTIHGCYPVRNSTYPLSVVCANKEQTDVLNKQVCAGLEDADCYKHIVAYDGLSNADADALANSKNGDRVKVGGFDKNKVADLESGGMSEARMNMIEYLRLRADRNFGTSDSGRGMVSGRGTATENAIADSNSSTRTGFISNQFRNGVNKDIRKLCWYLRNDYRTSFLLDDGSLYLGGYDKVKAVEYAAKRGVIKPEIAEKMAEIWKDKEKILAAAQMEEQQAQQEGRQPRPLPPEIQQVLSLMSDERMPFEELDIEIEAYSMERTDEALQQRRLSEGGNMIINQMPLVPQFPFFDWKRWFDISGEALNLPSLGSLLNVDGMKQAQQQMQAMQQAEMEATTAQAEAAQGTPDSGMRTPPKMKPAGASSAGQGSGLPGNRSGARAGAATKSGGGG